MATRPSEQLSPELEALALQIARLSRLSRRLRADVADLAAAEIADHLRHGVPASEVPARMGPPAEVARRLRRERLRRRFLPLRFLTGWKSAVLGTLFLIVLLYSGALVWFHTARPLIARNFAAELGAAVEALPGERAEALYLKALDGLPDIPEDLGKDGLDAIPTDDPRWARVLEHLGTCQDSLRIIREASSKPVLGMKLTDGSDPRWATTRAGRAAASQPPTPNPTMVLVSLPQLGAMRNLARLLATDSLAAADAGDNARATEDLLAMSGLARHASEYPFLICDMVTLAIDALQSDRIGRIVERYPGLFTDEQLVSLAKKVGERRVGAGAIRFDGERVFIQDFAQRSFTDDGRGDGRLCAAGLRNWYALMDNAGTAGGTHLSAEDWLLGPVISFGSASRKQLLSEWEQFISKAEKAQRQPRWVRGRGGSGLDASVEAIKVSAGADRARQMLASLIPALGVAIERCDDATENRDGTLVVIAIERYRLAHGAFPSRLADLVPAFLESVPPDRFDGKPLRYVLRNGRPVLYSVGGDLKDDGGRPPSGTSGNDQARRWRSAGSGGQPADGDFVIWPRPVDPVGGK